MSVTLGIDQSYTSSGFAVVGGNGDVLEFGTFRTTEPEHGSIFHRAILIADFIVTLAHKYDTKTVGLEGLAFAMMGNATRDLAGLQAIIITTLLRNGIDPIVITPNEVKKRATGSGKAKKPEMAAALSDEFRTRILAANYKKTTGLYDITDAYWIATCVRVRLHIEQ